MLMCCRNYSLSNSGKEHRGSAMRGAGELFLHLSWDEARSIRRILVCSGT